MIVHANKSFSLINSFGKCRSTYTEGSRIWGRERDVHINAEFSVPIPPPLFLQLGCTKVGGVLPHSLDLIRPCHVYINTTILGRKVALCPKLNHMMCKISVYSSNSVFPFGVHCYFYYGNIQITVSPYEACVLGNHHFLPSLHSEYYLTTYATPLAKGPQEHKALKDLLDHG